MTQPRPRPILTRLFTALILPQTSIFNRKELTGSSISATEQILSKNINCGHTQLRRWYDPKTLWYTIPNLNWYSKQTTESPSLSINYTTLRRCKLRKYRIGPEIIESSDVANYSNPASVQKLYSARTRSTTEIPHRYRNYQRLGCFQ